MTDQTIQLSALVAIRDQAKAELVKARKSLEAAELRVSQAEMKVRAYDDAIEQLTTGDSEVSQKHMVLQVLSKHQGEGMSAKEILLVLTESGFHIASQNKEAAIHVAAGQLQKDGLVEVVSTPTGKVFKRRRDG